MDAGLLFERDSDWFGGTLQTLEPRIYYLYVPFRDQTDIPLFDTAVPDANIDELFRDNRFIGADRQGDANQLSTALTSRLLAPATGRVLLEASIGQTTYFSDRRVTLGTGAPETVGNSELIAELRSDLSAELSVAATGVYEPETSETARSNLGFSWRPDELRRLDFSYRFRRGSLEQTDLVALWPLGRSWRAVAHWNYSLLDKSSLETLAGLEYRSCCWALRFGTRQYVFDRTGQTDRTYFLQLELTGLARVGKPLDELIDRGATTYGIPENL